MNYHKEFTKLMMELNESDYTNPDVYVDGLGTYDLKTLKINATRGVADMLEQAQEGKWETVKRMMPVIHAKMDSIIDTQNAIEAQRKRGGRPRKR